MSFFDFLFVSKEASTAEEEVVVKNPETKKGPLTYGEVLGLNKSFAFVVSRQKVKDDLEWNDVIKKSQETLIKDLKRLGENPEVVPKGSYKLAQSGTVTLLLMRITADKEGNIEVRFFRREPGEKWIIDKEKEIVIVREENVLLIL